jgi:group I intron endonuclease
MQFPGIYKIINKTNGKYYVGSSRVPTRRWKQHKYTLIKNIHTNDYLQHSWNKYNGNFEFVIVDTFSPTITDAELLKEEQKWLDIAKQDYSNNKCYNLTFVANNPNMLLSEYSKKKRSESLKRVVKTKEWKEKISKSHIGLRPSADTLKKMRLSRLGKKQTEKQRERATESRRKIGYLHLRWAKWFISMI